MLNTPRFQANNKAELIGAIANYKVYGIDFYFVNDCLEDLSYFDNEIFIISHINNIIVAVLPNEYCTAVIQYDDEDYVQAIKYKYGF